MMKKSNEKEDFMADCEACGFDEKVHLNIGGVKFTTFASTLKKIPGTRLSDLSKSDLEYDSAQNEYFFDRNPKLFPFILDGFRLGTVHFPHCFCAPIMKAEVEFWEIPDDIISSCSWRAYEEHEEEKRVLEELTQALDGRSTVPAHTLLQDQTSSNWVKWKTQIWLFLEHPSSSPGAKVRLIKDIQLY